jgi:hypothetical protein
VRSEKFPPSAFSPFDDGAENHFAGRRSGKISGFGLGRAFMWFCVENMYRIFESKHQKRKIDKPDDYNADNVFVFAMIHLFLAF